MSYGGFGRYPHNQGGSGNNSFGNNSRNSFGHGNNSFGNNSSNRNGNNSFVSETTGNYTNGNTNRDYAFGQWRTIRINPLDLNHFHQKYGNVYRDDINVNQKMMIFDNMRPHGVTTRMCNEMIKDSKNSRDDLLNDISTDRDKNVQYATMYYDKFYKLQDTKFIDQVAKQLRGLNKTELECYALARALLFELFDKKSTVLCAVKNMYIYEDFMAEHYELLGKNVKTSKGHFKDIIIFEYRQRQLYAKNAPWYNSNYDNTMNDNGNEKQCIVYKFNNHNDLECLILSAFGFSPQNANDVKFRVFCQVSFDLGLHPFITYEMNRTNPNWGLTNFRQYFSTHSYGNRAVSYCRDIASSPRKVDASFELQLQTAMKKNKSSAKYADSSGVASLGMMCYYKEQYMKYMVQNEIGFETKWFIDTATVMGQILMSNGSHVNDKIVDSMNQGISVQYQPPNSDTL